MKNLIKKILCMNNSKKIQKPLYIQNVIVGQKTLQNIKLWETQKNDLIIRSNFNRELYYKYLEIINL
tara:strand:- start:12145 stop:12345 length:201 start_codon:yes stop_codon:yes gene_type:complete